MQLNKAAPLVALLCLGCRQAPAAPSPVPAISADASTTSSRAGEAPRAETDDTGVKAQLRRISRLVESEHFEAWDNVSKAVLASPKLDEGKLSELGHWTRKDVKPSAVYAMAVSGLSDWQAMNIGEKQLRKTKTRYAGHPYWIEHAKIVYINEDDDVLGAEVVPEGWHDHLAVAGRFITDFVEGDVVEIVGFLTSTAASDSHSSTMAAIALLKPGTISAMNKQMGFFHTSNKGE